MSVTILDVAKEAGVSKSTVSLVINNSNSIKLETQYKVKQAIEKLGYTPNLAARELTTSRTHTLGLIFMTSNQQQKPYGFSSVCETLLYDTSNGIYSGLKSTDYTLLVERFSDTGNSDIPELVKSGRLDGVFLIGGLFTGHFVEALQKHNIPLVIIGRQYEGYDSISVDTEAVGYMGAKYLLEQGHKKIAFINGPLSSNNSQQKSKGIQRALNELQLDPSIVETVHTGYSGQNGYEGLKQLWEKGYHPDAVFGASDGITSGILRFLYDNTIRVPDDISVLGYEDSILSEYSSPAITVIDAHKEIMGKEACSVLINRIKKPRSKVVNLNIAPSLIVRNSVICR
jgi:LacI family transcriptional regulator/LacI family purine nucleotide synthesis repressor